MPKLEFKPATRKQLKIKLGLMGTAGTGKTWNALAIAEALAPKGRIALIDSERGRAEAYAGDFKFDHLVLPSYAPEAYIEALSLANDGGYDVIIVDSISHEWQGRDGVLSSVDKFGGWKEATPRHDNFVDALFGLPRNVICTIRAKTQYLVEEIPVEGRAKPKQQITKLGVGPVQRDNLEYEFDLLGMVELDHSVRLHKSVIASLPSGSILEPGENPRQLGREIAFAVREWVESGEEVKPPEDASEAEIGFLRDLLAEEGFDEALIEQQFRKRRLELGALTSEYVSEQQNAAIERMTLKGIDVAPIQAKWGHESAAVTTNGDGAGTESREQGAEAASRTVAERESGEKTGTPEADEALGAPDSPDSPVAAPESGGVA